MASRRQSSLVKEYKASGKEIDPNPPVPTTEADRTSALELEKGIFYLRLNHLSINFTMISHIHSVVTTCSGKQTGVQFITPVGPRQSLL